MLIYRLLIIVVTFIWIVSCNTLTVSQEERVVKELLKEYKLKSPQASVKSIAILSERGCLGCNERYYAFLQKKCLNKPDLLIYNCGIGRFVDFSAIDSSIYKNVLMGTPEAFRNSKFFMGSYYITLTDDSTIDTIYSIRSDEALSGFNFIKNK